MDGLPGSAHRTYWGSRYHKTSEVETSHSTVAGENESKMVYGRGEVAMTGWLCSRNRRAQRSHRQGRSQGSSREDDHGGANTRHARGVAKKIAASKTVFDTSDKIFAEKLKKKHANSVLVARWTIVSVVLP